MKELIIYDRVGAYSCLIKKSLNNKKIKIFRYKDSSKLMNHLTENKNSDIMQFFIFIVNDILEILICSKFLNMEPSPVIAPVDNNLYKELDIYKNIQTLNLQMHKNDFIAKIKNAMKLNDC